MPRVGVAVGLFGVKFGPSTWWDKMWASYVSLNPGTYSAAVKAEFINRCKPTYVDSVGTGYYYNTFGPAGQNKTTADWIYLLTTSRDVTSRTWTKSGQVPKWNIDGTIVTQTSLPSYTKGTNAGIITVSSTDGWGGVTYCDLLTNYFYGVLPTFIFPNNGRWALSSGSYLQPQWDGNIFSAISSNALVYLYCQSSGFVGTTDFTKVLSTSLSVVNFNYNKFPTSEVDKILNQFNTFFSTHPLIKNLTLDLSGATMGIPTGGSSNPDYLNIIQLIQNAGYIPNITIRTT